MKKETPKKVVSGLMSGVMLFSSTGAPVMAETPADGSSLNTTGVVQKGAAPTAEQSEPQLYSRTDTTVTLKSNAGTYYTGVAAGTAVADVIKDAAWTQASGETIALTSLTAGTAYDFYSCASNSGMTEADLSPAATLYTLQAAPTVDELQTITFAYPEETIQFDAARYDVNTSSDFGGTAIANGSSISDYVGRSLYVRKVAKGEVPFGVSASKAVDARPANTTSVSWDAITRTTTGFSFTPAAGGVYQYSGGSVTTPRVISGGKVTGLQPGTAYTLVDYTAATDDAFASGSNSQTVRTKSVVAPVTKDGPGASDRENTVEVDKTEADANEVITYTVHYNENHTPSLTIGDTELAFTDAGVDAAARTAVFEYTVTEADTTVQAKVHFNDRAPQQAARLDTRTLYANDTANASAEALMASLPGEVSVTYDNGTTGAVSADWQMKKESRFNIKGGSYVFEAALAENTKATQAVTVLPVYAAFDAFEDTKLPIKAGGYNKEALGLADKTTVTYTGNAMKTYEDKNVPVVWEQTVPAGFGSSPTDSRDFTGTVSVPEWATIADSQVSRSIKFGIPLTIKGLSLYNRPYDGTDVAKGNIADFANFTLYDGNNQVQGLSLDSDSNPVVHLDSANVGRRTVKSIDDLAITGPEADKYVLDFSSLSTDITRQTNVAAPTNAPTIDADAVTDNAVTVSVASSAENYALEYAAVEAGGTVDSTTQWQNSGEFTGLKPGTEYTFYARYAETSNNEASPAGTGSAVQKTDAKVAVPTKSGAGKNDPGCTVTADVEHAAVGEKVTYTVKTTENYTIGENIKINGQDAALQKGSIDPETGMDTYTCEYRVLAADTTITAEASFNKREVKTVSAAAYTAIDASDSANASQQALEQSLPQTVAVTYDNGASGDEPVLWTLQNGEEWDITGGNYTYNGKLANGSAVSVANLSVVVNKVNATLPAIADKTIAVRDKAYTMDELGLGKSLEVTFMSTASGAQSYTQDCSVSWNPATPGSFGTTGSKDADKTFTGTVTLPDWATVDNNEVEAKVKTAKALTVTGATVTSRAYDGTTTANLDISGASVAGAVLGEDVSLNTSDAPNAVFENTNAGANKKVIIKGGTLTGDDAGKYIINWEASNITGEITKAPVSSTPAAPTVEAGKTTATSVTLTAMTVDGTYTPADVAGAKMQYSKDNVNWQDSPVFGGLEPGSSYRFYARVGATANTNASAASTASAQATTKTAVLEPVLEKDGDCAAGQSCKIELLDKNGNKINGVLEAEPGTEVIYKMSYCSSHTLQFNFKGSALALSEATPGMSKSKDEDRTWLYTYTVKKGDKTITASASADEHSVKSFEAEKIELFANDPANQSKEGLKALLPASVKFTYDNGVTGTDMVTGWALKDGEWNIKGSTLTYEGSLKTMPKVKVTQKVVVTPVTATFKMDISLTVKQRDEGYTASELAVLGLPMNASVSYDTFVDPGDKTCSIDWELPEGFGKEAAPASDITGTVTLPEWATSATGTSLLTAKMTVDARPEASLTINAADVQKVYDGTPVITDVPIALDASGLETGHKDVSLSGATATVRFQEPNVGSGLTYTVEDVRLTGADAQWYALKTTYSDGEITEAPVDKPAAPTIAEITTDTITLNTVEPEGVAGIAGARVVYGYSDNGGKNFKSNDTNGSGSQYSPVFKGLEPGKEYQFAVGIEATDNTTASAQSDSLTARTKFNPGTPIISKASSCTAEVECKIELTDAAGKPIDEDSALGAGDRVTYRITSCDNHTPIKLLANSTEIPLMGTGNTRTGVYTITEKDSGLVSKVTLSDRQVTGVTNPEMLSMYANDDCNQSEKALQDSLPKAVEVTYDNGTKGSEQVNQWQMNTGSYSPAGGMYIYTATTVSGRIVLQMVNIMEVEAVYEQPGDLTLQTNVASYSAADLGLVPEMNVTFKSADGVIQETAPVAVAWSPQVPEGFGVKPAEQNFTGTLAIPAYAGGAKTVDRKVSIVAETPLKLTGLVVLDKTYDGTAEAVINTDHIGLEGFVEGQGSVMLEGVDTMKAEFEDTNAGAGKRVKLSGLSLTGPDAKYYSLDTSGYTGKILKADITDVTFESAVVPEDGKTHELKAAYPENCGITNVQYTYTKDGVTSSTAPKEAGVYKVKAMFSVDSNHNALAPMEATLTIGNGAPVEAPEIAGIPEGATGAAITADKEVVTEAGETIEYTLTPSTPAAMAYVPYALEVNGESLAVELDTKTHTYHATYTVTDKDMSRGVQAKGLYTLLGDSSGEGAINGADALRGQRYAAGLDTPTYQEKAAADVNQDGKINAADALMIKRFAAKLIDKF